MTMTIDGKTDTIKMLRSNLDPRAGWCVFNHKYTMSIITSYIPSWKKRLVDRGARLPAKHMVELGKQTVLQQEIISKEKEKQYTLVICRFCKRDKNPGFNKDCLVWNSPKFPSRFPSDKFRRLTHATNTTGCLFGVRLCKGIIFPFSTHTHTHAAATTTMRPPLDRRLLSISSNVV